MSNFKIMGKTRTIPARLFAQIKKAVLGNGYRLNLIVSTPAEMKKLNTIYRDKPCPTDILSFPIDDRSGEIYLSPSESRKMSRDFGMSYESFLPYLFIHGCVHLKGYDHGVKMESIEARYRKLFKV